MQYAGIDKLTSPASLDVYRAALLDSIDICSLCEHWAHKPCEKGWCDPCIKLSSPFGIWENLPEPVGDLWEALDDSISLLACRFALQGTRSRVLHQSCILRLQCASSCRSCDSLLKQTCESCQNCSMQLARSYLLVLLTDSMNHLHQGP